MLTRHFSSGVSSPLRRLAGVQLVGGYPNLQLILFSVQPARGIWRQSIKLSGIELPIFLLVSF